METSDSPHHSPQRVSLNGTLADGFQDGQLSVGVIIVVVSMAVVFIVILVISLIICRKWQSRDVFKSMFTKRYSKRGESTNDDVFFNESSVTSESVTSQSSQKPSPRKPSRTKTIKSPPTVSYENVELPTSKDDSNSVRSNGRDKSMPRHKSLKMQIANHKDNYENVKLMATLNNIPLKSENVDTENPSPKIQKTTLKLETAL